MTTEHTTAVRVTVRGTIADGDREYAVRKIEAVLPVAHAPVLSAHLVLEPEGEHAHEHRARVEVGLDLNGTPVRAHISAGSVREAADLVQERLRRRLTAQDRQHGRRRFTRLAHQEDAKSAQPVRAVHRSVPAEDRKVLRRKTFALHPMTAEQAADEFESLDHDFYLFADRVTGADAVICRRRVLEGPGAETAPAMGDKDPAEKDYLVLVSAPVLSEELARERLEVSHEVFVFYRDTGDGRGRVLYRRRDGHDGLITPV